MNYYSQLRKRAKDSLRGFWLRAIVALSAWLTVSAAVNMLFKLGMVLTDVTDNTAEAYIWLLAMIVGSNLIAAPFGYGFRLLLWRRTEGEYPSVYTVFELFGSFRRLFGSLLLKTAKYVIAGLPAVIMIVPQVVYSGGNSGLPLLDGVLSVIFVGVALIGVIYAVYMYLRLFAADFVFVGEDISPFKAICRSFKLTKGKLSYIISVFFRFIPWLLLNLTGFGQLYVTPCFETVKCHLVADLIKYEQPSPVETDAVPDGGMI